MNPHQLPTPEEIDRVLQERSLHEYILAAWKWLEPGRTYHDNWHIQSICEHLEAVAHKELFRLIINIPPRHMKSLITSVAFPTWTWIHYPNTQFLTASYATSLATRDSIKCRRLINTEWYQENWGHKFKMTGDQNQKQRYENNHNGHRLITSINAGVTGEGGDIIIVDDPHNVVDAESEQMRHNVIDWWDTALPSRLNDPKTGAFVVIQQRVHENDLTGHILKYEGEISQAEHGTTDTHAWTHLNVPAEYECNHPYQYRSILMPKTIKNPNPITNPDAPDIEIANTYPRDPRTEESQLLWPTRFGRAEIDRLARTMGSYAAAGQLQQRPAPKGGGIVKKKWWRKWENPTTPTFLYVLQSWDTAFSEQRQKHESTSYSACTTWGVFTWGGRYHIMIMNRFRDHLSYPDLRRKAKDLYKECKPDAVIIEKKASGQSLIQDLRLANIPLIEYTPDRDKTARLHAASILIESGLVWYPERKWAEEVINWCAVFPAGDGSDIVDTVSQALIRLRTMWYGTPSEDDDFDPEIPDREDEDNIIDLHSHTSTRTGAIYG